MTTLHGLTPAVVTLAVGAIASLAWLLLLLRDVAADLLKSEVRAWLPHLSVAIVRRAARALPAGHHDFLEVWESDLEDFEDRPLTMLAVAIRIALDRKRIAVEIDRAKLEGTAAESPAPQNAWPRKWGSTVAEAVFVVGRLIHTRSVRLFATLNDVELSPSIKCPVAYLLVMGDLFGMMYLPETRTGYIVVLVGLGLQFAWLVSELARLLLAGPARWVLNLALKPSCRDRDATHRPDADSSVPIHRAARLIR